MADAKRDSNRVPTLLAVSSADSITPVVLEADPTTKALNISGSFSLDSSLISDNSLAVSSAYYSLQNEFEATTGWTESTGADNLETDVDHRGVGTKSLEFDKVAGDATAMISKTITSFDMSAYSSHAIGLNHIYISDLTNVSKVFVRIGTDASHYCQWDFADTTLATGWNKLQENITTPTSQTGNGYNLSAITYLAFGVVFDADANTLSDIRTCGWVVKRVLETNTILTSDISVDVPFVALRDWNSNTRLDVASGTYNHLYSRNTDGTNLMPTGDADARALYVNLGSNNDVTVTGTVTEASASAIKTAVEIMDDWDDSNYCNVNLNVAGTDVAGGSGTISAQTLRVTIATDDPVNDAMVELSGAIDTEMQVDVVGALPAGTNAIGKLAANSGVDIGDVDVTSITSGSINGPGVPTVDSYVHASINLAAGANQVLASSSASHQIWVYGIGFTVNVAGTVSFQDEDDTAITGIMPFAASSGMVVNPSGNFAMPIWKLATDKDLEIDIVTSELDGWICYAIVNA